MPDNSRIIRSWYNQEVYLQMHLILWADDARNWKSSLVDRIFCVNITEYVLACGQIMDFGCKSIPGYVIRFIGKSMSNSNLENVKFGFARN